MRRVRTRSRHALAAAALIVGIALSGCGGDDELGATNSADNRACKLLPPPAVEALIPGVQRDDLGLPTPTTCFYQSSDRNLIVSYFSEDPLLKGLDAGQPSLQQMYDTALSDATNEGAATVRSVPSLGDDGKLAVDADEQRLTAVWKRDDVVYMLEYLFENQSAGDAIRSLTALARQVRPVR